MNANNKHLIVLLLVSILMLTVVSLTGCKKKPESTEPTETKEVVSETIEQKTCPVMGGAINKSLYTEYKGKKVYFCCPGCKGKFEKEPDKYTSKLPQFSN